MNRNPVNALVKAFEPFRHQHNLWQVWQDFVEMAAICMSRADLAQFETREARYMEIIKRYSKEEAAVFPQIFAELTMALQDEPADILGAAFMQLELGNKWAGQFFTPQALCDVMAAMTFDDSAVRKVKEYGFVTLNDPAVGGGALVIGACKAMLALGLNYQQQLHVVAQDVDIKSVHMTYVQLSLLHVPAVVIHGNTLSNEQRSLWFTPAHIMGGWDYKLRKPVERAKPPAPPKPAHLLASHGQLGFDWASA